MKKSFKLSLLLLFSLLISTSLSGCFLDGFLGGTESKSIYTKSFRPLILDGEDSKIYKILIKLPEQQEEVEFNVSKNTFESVSKAKEIKAEYEIKKKFKSDEVMTITPQHIYIVSDANTLEGQK